MVLPRKASRQDPHIRSVLCHIPVGTGFLAFLAPLLNPMAKYILDSLFLNAASGGDERGRDTALETFAREHALGYERFGRGAVLERAV